MGGDAVKRFTLSKTVSGRSWREVDQTKLWETLKAGLDEVIGGAGEAIAETYAVVRGEIEAQLAAADCLLPHHEVSDKGLVALNKAALVAATAALTTKDGRGDMTDEEVAQAKAHLLRHYHEAEMPVPESLSGEMVGVTARICGEMEVGSIPASPSVDLKALKEGDDDPLELVVEIPAGKSKRGWDYLPRSLQDIVDVVNGEGLPGFEGHQSPSNVDWEFRTPVTHWVGAKFEDGKAYFRGIVDKAAADLKRWIRGGAVKTVSIWGMPKLAYQDGETKVVGYEPLSIDWTPPRRAGMPTRIVAMGEMDSTLSGEMDGSYEDLREELRAATSKRMGIGSDGKDGWLYVERTFPGYVIAVVEKDGRPRYYKLDYAVDGDKVVMGDPVEVELKRTYEPVQGRTDPGGAGEMNWKELTAKLKSMLDSKEVTLGQVIGEMGLTAQAVAGEMDEIKKAMDAAEALSKVSKALGVTGEMNVVEVAKSAAEAVEAQQKAAQQAMVDEVLAEKVKGEMAKGLVMRMLQVPDGATKEQVSGEIDRLLADETVKGALSRLHLDPPAPRGSGDPKEPRREHTRVKRVGI
jgi:hypothetical protein